MQKWKMVIPALALLICGCEIKDEDRCMDGQTFDPAQGVCLAPAGADTSSAPASSDTSGAGGVVMKECQSDADCAGNGTMTYCLPNGMDATQPGACVQDNCVPDACPSGQECCDCSSQAMFGWPSPLCWPEDMVGGTYGVETFGCECTPNTTVSEGTFMLECSSGADCANNGSMTYCLENSFDTSAPGSCVQDNCVPDACPTGQECCDCTAVEMIVWPSNLCMPEMLRTGTYGYETQGCTCD